MAAKKTSRREGNWQEMEVIRAGGIAIDSYGPVAITAEQPDIAPIRVLEQTTFAQKWKSKPGKDGFKLCRDLINGDGPNAQPNEWLRPMYDARFDLANDGFRIVVSAASRHMLDKKYPWFELESAQLAEEVMREFLMMDNAAVYWNDGGEREDGSIITSVLKTEEIDEYVSGNEEILSITPAKREIPKESKDTYEKRWYDAITKGAKITFDQEKGEFFNVVTNANRGQGLAKPSIVGCLDILAHLEAVRTGDMAGAWDSRYVIKHWLIGHEIRNGERAGTRLNFATPKKLAAFKAALRQKVGMLVDLYTNFDVDCKYRYIPAEFFSEKKYEGALMRLRRWGSALAALTLPNAPDGVLLLARAEIMAVRAKVARLLETVFNRPEYGIKLKKGERIRVGWNPATFMTARDIAANVGQWLGNGMISMQTAREISCFDHKTEMERLQEEANTPIGNRPNFEAKQGMLTADLGDGKTGAEGKGGKPAKAGKGGANTPDNGGSLSPANGRPAGS